jgi:hypothetical protein
MSSKFYPSFVKSTQKVIEVMLTIYRNSINQRIQIILSKINLIDLNIVDQINDFKINDDDDR